MQPACDTEVLPEPCTHPVLALITTVWAHGSSPLLKSVRALECQRCGALQLVGQSLSHVTALPQA